MIEKIVQIVDFTRKCQTIIHNSSLDSIKFHGWTETVIIISEKTDIDEALADITRNRCAVVILGEEDYGILPETYECFSTKDTLLKSLERLLIKRLLMYVRCLALL